MIFKQLFDHDTCTYTYLLADADTREAVIIDPVIDRVDRDHALIAELDLTLLFTLDTHIHADHITGSGELRLRTGARSGVSAVSEVPCVDLKLRHGDALPFGRHTLLVRSTPGHTDGCLTYVLEDEGQVLAFTGDAIFIRGCGRTDFQRGDAATLYRSVHQQIFSLPDNTIIYPGHDYRGHSATTVGEEKAHNPRLSVETSEADFVSIMASLDLSYPKRIHEALPANLACGFASDGAELPDSIGRSVLENSAELSLYDVIDVRSPEEFDGPLGHLPNATLVPLGLLQDASADWARDRALLLVCRTGRRSARACLLLAEQGFTNLTNLDGGMVAWRERDS